jgi:cellulose synthase/poly-beta-1,6-N-acetylglucosamine synthase-like glycosyltransferase
MTTVLIPAHNEEDVIAAAVGSALDEADDVVVVADNCTDATVARSTAAGAQVFVTSDNTAAKAGALNQALRRFLPALADDDQVLILDADTTLHEGFVAAGGRKLDDDRVGAVGGVFYGEPGGGLLGQLQRNEYARYARQISRRRRNEAFVLSGTSSMFRVRTLREIADARATGLLPSRSGEATPTYYDEQVLTEDNHMTLGVRKLGYRCASPDACQVTTEIMVTWRTLWKQRLRWQRGALENLGQFGFHRFTWTYWRQQFGLGLGVLLTAAYLLVLTVGLAFYGWQSSPLWIAVGLLFAAERLTTVFRNVDWRGRLLALAMIPEFCFDVFLMGVYTQSMGNIVLRRRRKW